jgi:hypothetical protein
MKLSQRFLAVGLVGVVGIGVLAPMASANDRTNRDVAIGLGVASLALLATHHYEAGAIGLGLTVIAAGPSVVRHPVVICEPPVRFVPVDRWRHDDRGRFRDRGRW